MSQIPLDLNLNLAPERKVWSVSEITARIRGLLERDFQNIWIEGEVSNFREAQSGHLYFTLKDANAQIRCVCFKSTARLLKFRPQDGLHITVRGSLSVYEQRGEYQIYAEHIEPVGLGALQLAFDQLKSKLSAEGLFAAERKKPLPLLPLRIGLITSPAGAAVRDILRILRRRFPNLRITLYPVRVQGDGAAGDVVEALRYFNRVRNVDVLILTRGGGSLEDLWAFNEESVARAIAASAIPTISAIGHETDFTIADFVADLRAPTPSAAAEIVVRTRQEFSRHIGQLRQQMSQQMRYRLLECRHRLQELTTHPGFRRLEDLLRQHTQQLDDLGARLGQSLGERLVRARQRFERAETRVRSFDLRAKIRALGERLAHRTGELEARIDRHLLAQRQRLERVRLQLEERSPLRVLERGYAIVYDEAGNVVRATDQVSVGDAVAVQLARGRLTAEVKKKEGK